MKLLSPVTESTTLVTLIDGQKNIHMPLQKHFSIACLPVYGTLSTTFNPNFRTPFYRTKLAGIPAKWIIRSIEECFFGYMRMYPKKHSTRPVMLYVSETFPGGSIGCLDPINWPLTYPGLTPLVFCLWGWMKSEAYKRKIYAAGELISHFGCCRSHKEAWRATQTKNTRYLHKSFKFHWGRRWDFRTFILNCNKVVISVQQNCNLNNELKLKWN